MRFRSVSAGIAVWSVINWMADGRAGATLQTPTSIVIGQPDGRPFILRVSPPAPKSSCAFQSFQTGPFGGYGGLPVTDRGGGVFAVTTGLRGQAATALKVAVWCRGFGMATIDITALSSSSFEAAVSLTPLPEIPMTGRVQMRAGDVSVAGASVRVFYSAPWLCGFFNLSDCGVPTWEVGQDRITDDGTFRVMVPDFVGDPVAQMSTAGWPRARGEFNLRVDRTSAPFHYWLVGDGSMSGAVPVAAAYPDLVLSARRR